MKVFAVFDTNILVSAMIFRQPDSAVVHALEALLSCKVTPLYNDEILAEYNNVLRRRKFNLPEDRIDKIIEHIIKTGIASERVHSTEQFPDPDDIVFYEVTLSKDNAYLVTGNAKHFPKTPIVVSPSEFLTIIDTL